MIDIWYRLRSRVGRSEVSNIEIHRRIVVWRHTRYLLTGLLMELRTALHALNRRAGVAVDSMRYEWQSNRSLWLCLRQMKLYRGARHSVEWIHNARIFTAPCKLIGSIEQNKPWWSMVVGVACSLLARSFYINVLLLVCPRLPTCLCLCLRLSISPVNLYAQWIIE